jgi:hypothetical protein
MVEKLNYAHTYISLKKVKFLILPSCSRKNTSDYWQHDISVAALDKHYNVHSYDHEFG